MGCVPIVRWKDEESPTEFNSLQYEQNGNVSNFRKAEISNAECNIGLPLSELFRNGLKLWLLTMDNGWSINYGTIESISLPYYCLL
jgi:hypothetical protein